MSKVIISVQGLAIMKPKEAGEKGLSVSFLDEEIEPDKCKHNLRLTIMENETEIKNIRVPKRSNITIDDDDCDSVPHLGNPLYGKLINMNLIHNDKLKGPYSQNGVDITRLYIPEALPYTLGVNDVAHKLVWIEAGREPRTIEESRYFTRKIGAEFMLKNNASSKIEILNIEGEDIEPLKFKNNTNYKVIFNNDCDDESFNDFEYYYKVLKSSTGREIKGKIDLSPANHDADLIACNPVEGGGGS